MCRRAYFIIACALVFDLTSGQLTLTGSTQVSLGTEFRLTCDISNPSGTTAVIWRRNPPSFIAAIVVSSCLPFGTVDSNYTYTCSKNRSKFYLTIPANKMTMMQQGTRWRCDGSPSGSSSNTYTLSISIPVTNVSISSNPVDATPVNLIDGIPQTFRCTPDSAATPPFYCSWYKGDKMIDTQALQTDISVSKEENMTVSCKCNNSVTTTLSAASSKPVNILFAPVLRKFPNQRIKEGQRLNVACSVIESNPPVTTYSWTRNNESVGSQDTLEYTSILRNQAGIYKCTASNTMIPTNGPTVVGIASQTMDVNVIYKPNITAVYIDGGQRDVAEGTRVVITALIDSNPDPYEVQWINEGNGQVVQTESRIQHQSYLILNSAHCLNTTTYSVTAVNEVGSSKNSVSLNVTCLPKIDDRYITADTIQISVGSNLYLPFRYLSNPPLKSCVWFFKPYNESSSQTKELSSSGNILVINSKLSSVEHVSILSITYITAKDFGVYSVELQQCNSDRKTFHYNVSESNDDVQLTCANRCNSATMFVGGVASAFGLLSIAVISYLIVRKYRTAAKVKKQEIEERYDSIEIHHKGPNEEYSTIAPGSSAGSDAALGTGTQYANS